MPARTRARISCGMKPPCGREVRQPVRFRRTTKPIEVAHADDDETDDRGHLDGREPELELAVRPRRHQVHDRERAPSAPVRPAMAGSGIHCATMAAPAMASIATTTDPEVPVEPAA